MRLVDALPIQPEQHVLLLEPLSLDEALDARTNQPPFEILALAALIVGRSFVVRVVRVAARVEVLAIPPCVPTVW